MGPLLSPYFHFLSDPRSASIQSTPCCREYSVTRTLTRTLTRFLLGHFSSATDLDHVLEVGRSTISTFESLIPRWHRLPEIRHIQSFEDESKQWSPREVSPSQWNENLVFLCFDECSSLRLQRINSELISQTRTIVYPQGPVDGLQLTCVLQHVYAVWTMPVYKFLIHKWFTWFTTPTWRLNAPTLWPMA